MVVMTQKPTTIAPALHLISIKKGGMDATLWPGRPELTQGGAMSVINTNIQSMVGLNNLRVTGLGLSESLERLSSGYRINKAADDPSGLAIATGQTSQIRGIEMAIQNSEDTINLIQTADAALSESDNILQRMRELAVRAANEAVLTTADRTKLNNEFGSLMSELNRKANAVTFNTKHILNGATTLATGASAQVGPDNSTVNRLTISIKNTRPVSLGGDITAQKLTTTTKAQSAITLISGAITSVAAIRAGLGTLQRRLGNIINDLTAEDINISAARSRIQDTDFSAQISTFTKLQILQQSGTAILAQANAQPQSVLQLLH